MALRLTVDPATEPVSTAEAKAQMRVVSSADDTLIAALIVAARQQAENILGRALMQQTWQKTLDEFPDAIELPYPPIQSVTTLDYVEPDGTTVTLAAGSYVVDTASEPGWIVPAYGYDWPDTREQINAVIVTYVTGYADAAAVPQAIKQWILLMVAHYYENREATVPGVNMTPLPFIGGLLDPYLVVRFG